MRATLTDEQETLREAAADLASGGREAARAVLEGRDLPREPTASLMAGFSGLAVPEADGGAGGDLVDLAIVLEALGRTVTPTPWVSHVLAVQVAHAAGIDVAEAAAGKDPWALSVDDGPVRDGTTCAGVLVVEDGRASLRTPAERTDRRALDPTRPLADLRYEGGGTVAGDVGDGLLRSTAALSAELAGVGRGAIDLAVGYAKVREQFGQPIGRFQAVAHQLADAWTGVEAAWSLALYACWAVSAEDPDAARSVHAAKHRAGEAAIHAAERGTQVHGGIGITWEADPHLFLRRAIADDQWLGSARDHRRRLADAIVGSR